MKRMLYYVMKRPGQGQGHGQKHRHGQEPGQDRTQDTNRTRDKKDSWLKKTDLVVRRTGTTHALGGTRSLDLHS